MYDEIVEFLKLYYILVHFIRFIHVWKNILEFKFLCSNGYWLLHNEKFKSKI